MYGNRHPVLERTVEGVSLIYAFCFSLLSLGLAGRRDTSHMRACMRDTCSRQPHAASCRRAGSCSVGVRGRGWTRRVERLERDHDLRSLLAPQCAAGAAPKLRTKSPGATMNKTIGTVRLPKLLVASRAAHPCAARSGSRGTGHHPSLRAPTAPCARVASRVPVRVGAWPRK